VIDFNTQFSSINKSQQNTLENFNITNNVITEYGSISTGKASLELQQKSKLSKQTKDQSKFSSICKRQINQNYRGVSVEGRAISIYLECVGQPLLPGVRGERFSSSIITDKEKLTGIDKDYLARLGIDINTITKTFHNQNQDGIYNWSVQDIPSVPWIKPFTAYYIGESGQVLGRIGNEWASLEDNKYYKNLYLQAAFKYARENNKPILVFVFEDHKTIKTDQQRRFVETAAIFDLDGILGKKDDQILLNIRDNASLVTIPTPEQIYPDPAYWEKYWRGSFKQATKDYKAERKKGTKQKPLRIAVGKGPIDYRKKVLKKQYETAKRLKQKQATRGKAKSKESYNEKVKKGAFTKQTKKELERREKARIEREKKEKKGKKQD
jgi:hypothetical protein